MPAFPDVLLHTAERALLQGLYALPAPVRRILGGKPVVLDGNTLDSEIQLLLKLLNAVGGGLTKPSLEARRASMRHDAKVAGGRQPIGSVEDLQVEGAEGLLPARLYVPRAGSDALLVFFHGGGYTLGDLDSHDAVCRFLAERAGVRVLAVDYRLAPEHPYPAGPDDAFASLAWAFEHAADLGIDPTRIAVGGDSAGGALAALSAIRAAEAGLALRAQLLIYPGTRMGESGPSRKLFADGFLLTDESMTFFEEMYIGKNFPRDPGHSVGFRTSFPDGLAPTIIAIAGFDPLRDEEKDYVALLQEHGQVVTEHFFPGLIHGFVNILGHGRSCREAVATLADELKAALA